jgi:two-component system, cell cycle response regulator DivK
MSMPVGRSHADRQPLALLVDRDADTRHMYAEFLRRSAYEIDEAEDGREALAKALTRNPDVIVTETRLPGMNGFEFCRLLRDDPATRDVAILFVTGDALDSDAKRAQSAGADAVLVKPCLPEDLAQEIRRVLMLSNQVRERTRVARERASMRGVASGEAVSQSHSAVHRVMLSRAHQRRDTTEPPTAPPALLCPSCDQPLTYIKSHIGGVSERHAEQWDSFECTSGCGNFQYRQRTRKLRRVM